MPTRKPKAKATPKRKAKTASKPDPKGPNAKAVEQTLAELKRLGRIEKIDAARVQSVRSIAATLDARPFNSQMWREMRESLKELTAHDDDDGAIQKLLAELSTAPRDTSTA